MTKPTVSGEIEKILEPLRRYSISIAFEQELKEALSKLEELMESTQEEALREGFYVGQANADISLDSCHENWKHWSTFQAKTSKKVGKR